MLKIKTEMGKVSLSCSGCQTKYRVTIQGEAKDKISFSCKKCGQILEIDPSLAKEEMPTTELLRAVCEKCGSEFVKNPEDDSRFCYQCRIDQLLSKKREEPGEVPKLEADALKSTARYTFRNPEGLILGPIKLRTAMVLIREKRITGKEEVSKDGSEFLPLVQYPELAEFFPELVKKPEPITKTEQIPLEEPEAPAPAPGPMPGPPMVSSPASAVVPEPALEKTDSKIYYLRLAQGKLLGPLRKTTVEDLIECGFLSGQDQLSKDQRIWTKLELDQEFQGLFGKEDAEVVELTETIEE